MSTRRQTIFAITALIGGTAAYAIGTSQNAANRYNNSPDNFKPPTVECGFQHHH